MSPETLWPSPSQPVPVALCRTPHFLSFVLTGPSVLRDRRCTLLYSTCYRCLSVLVVCWFGVCLSWLSVVPYGGTWPPCPSSTSGQTPLLFQNMDRDLHAEDHRPSAPGGLVKTHVAGLSPSGKSVGLGATQKCSQVMLPLLLGGTPLENHRPS